LPGCPIKKAGVIFSETIYKIRSECTQDERIRTTHRPSFEGIQIQIYRCAEDMNERKELNLIHLLPFLFFICVTWAPGLLCNYLFLLHRPIEIRQNSCPLSKKEILTQCKLSTEKLFIDC